MGFAVGKLDTLARKRDIFNGFDIMGDWVVDEEQKRGWIIKIVDGLEEGNFTVVDGKIHQSGIHSPGHVEERADVISLPGEAVLRSWTKQAIFDAIAQWEKDEREKPCT
jgi:hypothetical protein